MKRILLCLGLLLINCTILSAEDITITTYYPSPYGSYNEMQLYPHASPVTVCSGATKGTLYYDSDDSKVKICNGTSWVDLSSSGYWTLNPSDPTEIYNINTGNVGIGMTNPNYKLGIDGGAGDAWIQLTDSSSGALSSDGFFVGANDSGAYIIQKEDRFLRFRTNNSDRMTISNTGNVGIGTTGPTEKLHVNGSIRVDGSNSFMNNTLITRLGVGTSPSIVNPWNFNVWCDPDAGAGYECAYIEASSTSNNKTILRLANTSGPVVTFRTNGKVGIGVNTPTYQLQLSTNSAYKPTSGTWAFSSDMRLKKEIKDINNPLELMLKLHGRQFKWINSGEHSNLKYPSLGFIAQETEEIFPDWVGEVDPQGRDKELVKNGKAKTINIFGFEALTVEAMRQLKAENDALSDRITKLEKKLEEIENK